MSVIENLVSRFPTRNYTCSDQVQIRLILQLIKSISRVLQKLRKYFNDTAIFAVIKPSLLVLSKTFDWKLSNLETFTLVFFGSHLQN